MPVAPPKWLQLGLIGSGIGHSPSPAMHRAALHARDLQGDYTTLDVSPAELPGLLLQLRRGEFSGCNVTVPYKVGLEGDAAVCQAVNTLLIQDGELIGDNTDARGFELSLSYQRLRPDPGARAIVLGAGGGAAACVLALCRMRVDEVVVVARRPEQAEELCLRISPDARAVDWKETEAVRAAAREADIVVNASSTGVSGIPVPVDLLPAGCIVADLRYSPRPVDLVAAALARGLRAADGVEMLLFQGMLSFQRWTGVDPPWHAARAALEQALAG